MFKCEWNEIFSELNKTYYFEEIQNKNQKFARMNEF